MSKGLDKATLGQQWKWAYQNPPSIWYTWLDLNFSSSNSRQIDTHNMKTSFCFTNLQHIHQKFTNWKVHLMWFSMLLQPSSTQANLLLRTLRCGSASDRTSLVQMLGSANNSWNMLRPTFCCCRRRHLPPRLCFKYKMSIRISGWWAVQAMTSSWRGGRKSWRRKLGQMPHGIEQLLVLQNISWGSEHHDNTYAWLLVQAGKLANMFEINFWFGCHLVQCKINIKLVPLHLFFVKDKEKVHLRIYHLQSRVAARKQNCPELSMAS